MRDAHGKSDLSRRLLPTCERSGMKMFLLVEPVGVEPACRSDRYNLRSCCMQYSKARFSGVLLSHKVIDMTWEMLQVHEARLVRGQLCTPTSQPCWSSPCNLFIDLAIAILLFLYNFYRSGIR